MKDSIKCAYCGKVKNKVEFIIGAGRTDKDGKTDDFCMVYGTGKMGCPDCYPEAKREADDRINQHIKEVNDHDNHNHKGRLCS